MREQHVSHPVSITAHKCKQPPQTSSVKSIHHPFHIPTQYEGKYSQRGYFYLFAFIIYSWYVFYHVMGGKGFPFKV
jgi:hypothetical protein